MSGAIITVCNEDSKVNIVGTPAQIELASKIIKRILFFGMDAIKDFDSYFTSIKIITRINGVREHPWVVSLDSSIALLKQQFAKANRIGYPNSASFMYGNYVLKDDDTPESVGLRNGSVIDVKGQAGKGPFGVFDEDFDAIFG